MQAHFLTDVGQIRSHNEDSGGIFFNKAGQMLAIIADGMGGHQGGEIASQLAIDLIQTQWESVTEFTSPKDLEDWITENVQETNETVYNQSKQKSDLEGMGTTIVLAVCMDEFITIAHIGDSRCYIYKNDEFKQITQDHSLVNELIRTGQISMDDAEFHPRKNVLVRALGTEPTVNCEIQTMEWENENKILLCSDGLSNKIADKELEDYIRKPEEISEIAKQLIDLANERGGEDNISLAIVHHGSSSRAGEKT